MGLPIELPPEEVISSLEESLESKFSHYIVSKELDVEGIFIHHLTQEPISIVFEVKRTLINPEDELSRFVGEIDNGSLETMRNILESMLDNIEEQIVDEQSIIEFDKEFDPQYDDWYCP
jgi:hypothetical protein